jgi:hypothetical protein
MEVSRKQLKKISQTFVPKEQGEGVGAKVKRIIGTQQLDGEEIDPFIMLDFFKVRLPAGFPDHPHRGFETVTYMKEGYILHEDFKGHKGEIGPGDVQWMTAGKGIVHSEIPKSKTEYSLGFQLWINLKSEFKMCEPAYQEYLGDEIPTFKEEGKAIKVISGEIGDVTGPIYARQPTEYYDFMLESGYSHDYEVKPEWNCLIFVYKGRVSVKTDDGEQEFPKESALVFDPSSEGTVSVTALEDAGFILITGEPIKEPKVNYGPFVMNTMTEIRQTLDDYRNAKNGFEGADVWESEIKDLMHS